MTARERREQLLVVARTLFAEKGFEGTSVEEIASRAHVSKPVVYEHFGGKEGVYAVIVDREVQALLGALSGALSKKGHPVTAHMVEVSFDFSDTEEERDYLKHLPTSFKLSDEQVDRLISAGRNILRESPDFQAVLEALH